MSWIILWILIFLQSSTYGLKTDQLLAVKRSLEPKKDTVKHEVGSSSRRRKRVPVIANSTLSDEEKALPRMIKDPYFGYSISNSKLCNKKTNVFIWVHSAPNQFRKRLTLRETWANPHSFPSGYHVKVGFFLGLISGKSKRNVTESVQRLYYENELYGDIIQERFVDHYHNMTYKAISALRWITKYCPQAQLVIKSDDDTLVDLPLLLRHIHNLQSRDMMNNNTVICNVYQGARVQRQGKWMIFESEYNHTYFPNYCQGLAVVMTADVVTQLYVNSRKFTPLWIDDAWLFGVVINSTNAKFEPVYTKHDVGFIWWNDVIKHNELFLNNYAMFYHLHSIKRHHYLWGQMQYLDRRFEQGSVLVAESAYEF